MTILNAFRAIFNLFYKCLNGWVAYFFHFNVFNIQMLFSLIRHLRFVILVNIVLSYQDFLHQSVLLTRKLLSQGFIETRLRLTLKKFFGRYHHLTLPYHC